MENLTQFLSSIPEWSLWLIIPLALWSVVWKGLALWRAARQNASYWFVALLVINTAGILEILYIYVFSKKDPK